MTRRLEYYSTENGACPVEDFLDTLSAIEQRKVFFVLKLIEDMERVPTEYFKKLVNTEGIWECRIRCGSNAYWVFSFFVRKDTVVLTHGYAKKTQKNDPREILRAENFRRDYLTRKNRGES